MCAILVILLMMTTVMGVFIKIIISDQVVMQIKLESLEKNVERLTMMVKKVRQFFLAYANTFHQKYFMASLYVFKLSATICNN